MKLSALLRLPVLVTALTTASLCPFNIAPAVAQAPAAGLKDEVLRGMRKAADYYHGKVATRGGYVYYYLPDLSRRWGSSSRGS